jgi:hypothetical protein
LEKLEKIEFIRIKKDLGEHKVYLARFQKMLDLGDIRCHHPMTLVKMSIMALFVTARNQLLDYNIKAMEGKSKEVFVGLEKMNSFFVSSLEGEKLTAVHAMIYLTLLRETRRAIVTLGNLDERVRGKMAQSISTLFVPVNYEAISKRVEVGEMQAAKALLNYPFDRRWLQASNFQGEVDFNQPRSLKDRLLDKIANYFYLRNATLNDLHQIFKDSAKHPCVSRIELKCAPESRSLMAFVRNPMGEYFALTTVGTNAPELFHKINKRITNLPANFTP